MSDHKKEDWKRPPVTEVLLGVQFEPLPTLTNGHLGWFWGAMNSDFPLSDDAPLIQPVMEQFGEGPQFGFPMLGIRPATGDSRLRMMNADGTKMIQVQNGWLIANWLKKGNSEYPGFTGVKSLFDKALSGFTSFLAQRQLGMVKPNLWEVTYIDHIPRGTVWNDLSEVPSILPGLLGKCDCTNGKAEGIDATWSWRLSPDPGRLRVTVQTAQTVAEPIQEVLQVRSIARGPLGSKNSQPLELALEFGRSVTVETFNRLTSDRAKEYWRGGE